MIVDHFILKFNVNCSVCCNVDILCTYLAVQARPPLQTPVREDKIREHRLLSEVPGSALSRPPGGAALTQSLHLLLQIPQH